MGAYYCRPPKIIIAYYCGPINHSTISIWAVAVILQTEAAGRAAPIYIWVLSAAGADWDGIEAPTLL